MWATRTRRLADLSVLVTSGNTRMRRLFLPGGEHLRLEAMKSRNSKTAFAACRARGSHRRAMTGPAGLLLLR